MRWFLVKQAIKHHTGQFYMTFEGIYNSFINFIILFIYAVH